MGDTRSWGAEMESRTKTCPFGVKHAYFDNCPCPGCVANRERQSRIKTIARAAAHDVEQLLRETPDQEWGDMHITVVISKYLDGQ